MYSLLDSLYETFDGADGARRLPALWGRRGNRSPLSLTHGHDPQATRCPSLA